MNGILSYVFFSLWGILVRLGYWVTRLGVWCRCTAEDLAGVREYEMEVTDFTAVRLRLASFGGWESSPEAFLARSCHYWAQGESDWALPPPTQHLLCRITEMSPGGKPVQEWTMHGWHYSRESTRPFEWEEQKTWGHKTFLHPPGAR